MNYDGPRLDAHAWLESGGRVIHGEAELGRYKVLQGARRRSG